VKTVQLVIDIKTQRLYLSLQGQKIACYPISTAVRGVGEERGSFKTPRGKHRIRAKIGVDLPEGAILVRRRFTGEVYTPALAAQFPKRDWILSRILWLSGTQPGLNRLGAVDTMQRYIYIHGCPDSAPMGEPYSMGCIRMRNQDVMKLFDQVEVGTEVLIIEDSTLAPTEFTPIIRELTAQQASPLFLSNLSLPRYTTDAAVVSDGAYFYISWNPWGEIVAYARLRREGMLDSVCLQHPQFLQGLMLAIMTRVKQLGWFEIRAMVQVENMAYFQDFQFTPVGDIFIQGNQYYQQCRAFIADIADPL
jgi:hypothetical protein